MGRIIFSCASVTCLSATLLVLVLVVAVQCVRYQPNWDSLDSRPLPPWYDEAKFGIFIHWGVFSVPSYAGAWFWYYWQGPKPHIDVVEFMLENYRPGFTYGDFARQFTAEFYDPDKWAEIFNASGARYVVLTTKHHEGFCLWPTKHSWNWNAMDVGPRRDLVGELANAVRKYSNMKFGTYHSLLEFFNPIYLQDKKNNFTTNKFVSAKAMPELFELVYNYKPDLIWSDGHWEASYEYWNSTNFLAWLYNDSPVKDTVVTNDRWGKDCTCKHGGYLSCTDRYNPKTLQKRKFEDATTVYERGWGFRREFSLENIKNMSELITTLVQVVSCGGNMLLNVGPTKEGTIAPILEERLRQVGQWLGVNGEAIYATHPWTYQNDTLQSDVWYTSKKTASGVSVYAIALSWPRNRQLLLGAPQTSSQTQVSLLGYPGHISWAKGQPAGLQIIIPPIPFDQMPCKWAWVFKLDKLAN